MIFDAMYTSVEQVIEKENFGHSTAVIGINISLSANVKTLILFHHNPENSDSQIIEALNNAKKYLSMEKKSSDDPLNLMVAYDNLVIDV